MWTSDYSNQFLKSDCPGLFMNPYCLGHKWVKYLVMQGQHNFHPSSTIPEIIHRYWQYGCFRDNLKPTERLSSLLTERAYRVSVGFECPVQPFTWASLTSVCLRFLICEGANKRCMGLRWGMNRLIRKAFFHVPDKEKVLILALTLYDARAPWVICSFLNRHFRSHFFFRLRSDAKHKS